MYHSFEEHVQHVNNQMTVDMLYDSLDILEECMRTNQIDFAEYSNAFIIITTRLNSILQQYNCPTTFNT